MIVPDGPMTHDPEQGLEVIGPTVVLVAVPDAAFRAPVDLAEVDIVAEPYHEVGSESAPCGERYRCPFP